MLREQEKETASRRCGQTQRRCRCPPGSCRVVKQHADRVRQERATAEQHAIDILTSLDVAKVPDRGGNNHSTVMAADEAEVRLRHHGITEERDIDAALWRFWPRYMADVEANAERDLLESW